MKNNIYFTDDNRKLTHIATINGNVIIKEEDFDWDETKFLVCKGYMGVPPTGTYVMSEVYDTEEEAIKEAKARPNRI